MKVKKKLYVYHTFHFFIGVTPFPPGSTKQFTSCAIGSENENFLKLVYKSGEHISIDACLKGLQEEVTNYCPPTINKRCGAAISTDDTIVDWTLGTE